MSRVVFVGNVPYDMTEEQLTQVFSTVGPVAGFRLVFDRETGKAKGYGFCEFFDHESAASAVRNLHNTDVGGRSLRIDLADADPALEGKFTSRGEILGERDGHHGKGPTDIQTILSSIPNGVPVPPGTSSLDVITNAIVALGPDKQLELLQQMKQFITTNPDAARAVLVAHPQLAYACFQTMLTAEVVDPAVLQKMLAGGSNQPPPQQQAPPPAPPVPAPANQYQQGYYGAPPPQAVPSMPPMPPMPPMPSMPPNPQYPSYQTPPPAGPMVPTFQGVSPQQQAMIQQVLSLTPDQINGLPPNERAAIMQLASRRAPRLFIHTYSFLLIAEKSIGGMIGLGIRLTPALSPSYSSITLYMSHCMTPASLGIEHNVSSRPMINLIAGPFLFH
ncbi:cleavage stimulation factor subunit 2 RNA recognition motif protein [Rhizoctonia solani 123E]|uniref:Cleavage stimulation factor subunit 2 RNA recognition motif protein n=1 Tax=Rhizoctonia solani 123E TaxID=1423351 RepID=A0A074SYZ1_9AGAM|nr:cleavage stimulation factor subunit 2 RNA recognition motif protein [Rhizoctonia solani 123E]